MVAARASTVRVLNTGAARDNLARVLPNTDKDHNTAAARDNLVRVLNTVRELMVKAARVLSTVREIMVKAARVPSMEVARVNTDKVNTVARVNTARVLSTVRAHMAKAARVLSTEVARANTDKVNLVARVNTARALSMDKASITRVNTDKANMDRVPSTAVPPQWAASIHPNPDNTGVPAMEVLNTVREWVASNAEVHNMVRVHLADMVVTPVVMEQAITDK
jgi:hypothetical protein